MTKIEYFKYALQHKLLHKLDWYYGLFTIPVKDTLTTDYFVYKDNMFLLKIDDKLEPLEDYIPNTPELSFLLPITINESELSNVTGTLNTSIGTVVANYMLLVKNFDNVIPYVEYDLSVGDLEKVVAVAMEDGKISVKQYKEFVDTIKFMENISRIVTINATVKTMTPPKGITKYKVKLRKEFDAKYGKNWDKDMTIIVNYSNKLKEFYNDWLEGDVTDGVFTSGKIKNNAASKMYLTFGAEIGLSEIGDEVHQVDGSLLDKTPKDKAKIATMYNSSRAASFSRGNETQKGGAAAKDILRSTSSIVIVDNDCKVKYGKQLLVNKDTYKALVGRTVINGTKQVLINNLQESEALMGKTITIRSPQYCLEKGNGICGVCAGERLRVKPKGISLLLTNISSILLTSSLKKMHNSTVSTVNVDLIAGIR